MTYIESLFFFSRSLTSDRPKTLVNSGTYFWPRDCSIKEYSRKGIFHDSRNALLFNQLELIIL